MSITEEVNKLKELAEKGAKLTKVFEKEDGLLLQFQYKEPNEDGEYVIEKSVLADIGADGEADYYWFELSIYES